MSEENKELNKPTEVDIDALIAEKLAKKEKELEAKLKAQFEKEFAEKSAKQTKELEDIIIAREEANKAKNDEPKKKDEEVNVNNFIEKGLAEEILAKRKQQELEEKQAREQAELEKERKELAQLRLEKKLTAMLKDEPWMEEPVLEAMKEGTITTEDEIKIYFNKTAKEKFKIAWLAEKAAKKAGLDPMAFHENSGVMTDEAAKLKKIEQLREQWKKKLR